MKFEMPEILVEKFGIVNVITASIDDEEQGGGENDLPIG